MKTFLLAMLALTGFAHAANRYAVASGAWSSTLTWSGSAVPDSSDTAINTNSSITVSNATGNVNTLIWNTGTLTLWPNNPALTVLQNAYLTNSIIIGGGSRAQTFSNFFVYGCTFTNVYLVIKANIDLTAFFTNNVLSGNNISMDFFNNSEISINNAVFTNSGFNLRISSANQLTISNSSLRLGLLVNQSTSTNASWIISDSSIELVRGGSLPNLGAGRGTLSLANSTLKISTAEGEGRGADFTSTTYYLTNSTLSLNPSAATSATGFFFNNSTGNVDSASTILWANAYARANAAAGLKAIITNQTVRLIDSGNFDGGLIIKTTFALNGYNLTASNIVINAGTITSSNSLVSVNADLTRQASGVFSNMTSTVRLTGSLNSSISNIPTLFNLTSASAKSLQVISNLTVTSTASFSASGAAPGTISGSPCLLTLSNAGTAFGYGLSNIGVAAYRPLYTWGGVTDRKTATGNVQQVGKYQIIQ